MAVTTKVDALAAAVRNAFNTQGALRGDLSTLTTTNKTSTVAGINEVDADVGDLPTLSTTDKTNLVNAINEVVAAGSGSEINDTVTTLVDAWSSSKINNEIAAAITNLTTGASAGYDTFLELQTLMQADDTQTTAILNAQALRVAVDAPQSFTGPQQIQARANIDAASATDLGDESAFDPVATFNTGLVL